MGRVRFRLSSTQTGTYRLCVTDLTTPGWLHDPSRNVETRDTVTIL